MTYPTVEQVSTARVEALLRWNRHLPTPHTHAERAVFAAITQRLGEIRNESPGSYIRASRAVGFRS